MKQVRVIQKLWGLTSGGVETLVTSWQENIDRKRIKFDYLLNRNENEFYADKVISMGSKIIDVGMMKYKGNKIIRLIYKEINMYKILKGADYQIIHIHEPPIHALMSLLVAKIVGIKTRAVHSHTNFLNTKSKFSRFVLGILFKPISLLTTTGFACSEWAAKCMFSEKFIKSGKVRIIKNGINAKKYIYNENIRNKIRKELKIEGKFVIGNVGRLDFQKNQEFIIDVLSELTKKDDDIMLLLIGDGAARSELESKVKSLGLSKNVIFYGMAKNVDQLLQAMDVFIFPSICEGFGIAAIEAQAASLITICSDAVPKDVNVTEYYRCLDLDDGAVKWAEEVLKYRDGYARNNVTQKIIDSGYDIVSVSKCLEKYYLDRVGL